jgi:S1-C subfamily serine protease
MVRAGRWRDRICGPDLGIVALVSDTPEQPEGGDPGRDEDGAGGGGVGGGPDDTDAPLRGWIDPDDRLWRHPSEVAAAGTPGGGAGAAPDAPRHHPYRGAVMVLVGVAGVMAVVAWVGVLLSPASQHPLGTTAAHDETAVTLSTLAGPQNALPAWADAAGRSMVALQATTPRGTAEVVGIVVAEGGLVATMADALSGARQLVMIGPGGKHEPASVVATDSGSDIALVDVPQDLPVAPFADDGALAAGASDLTLSFVPGAGSSLALLPTPGSVTGVGAAIAAGPAGGMPSITTSAPAPEATAGAPLLDTAGAVVGVLYDPQPGTSSPVTFLPSSLVVGVANDLRSKNKVVHGWLGIAGGDVAGGGGARVETVQDGSPAAGRIAVGAVIVAVNTVPVRTMAELRARLYVLAPGSPVALSVEKPASAGGGTAVEDVTLSGSS